jgi:NAD(P)-dependent dehydrogenase (short-subunit alcohol dehydrogenase family)
MNILITGGSSGLGESLVRKLFSQHQVYFTYAKSTEKALKLESDCPGAKAFSCDFTRSESVQDFIQHMESFDLDILINNAYVGMEKNQFSKISIDHLQLSFNQNIVPALIITQEALKSFRKKRFGKIINVLSSAMLGKPSVGWSEYIANKAYLMAMSRSWASENSRYNITSNSISPGFMKTAFTQDTDERVIEQMVMNNPLGRLLTPEEVTDAFIFLIQCSQQVNGINLSLDNGLMV